MNVALRRPVMTREEFFAWAQVQEGRFEFDGFKPVAMTGGTLDHNRITLNIHRALYARLRGTGCEALSPDAGVATIGNTVRYPDALVTCSRASGDAMVTPDVVVVFEVVSATSDRVDRIVKPREYGAVASIRRYVIVERLSIALTLLHRADAGAEWRSVTLMSGDTLAMPEVGIEVPVDEFYEGLDLPADTDPDPQPAA